MLLTMYERICGELALMRQQQARQEKQKRLPEMLRRKVVMAKETSGLKEM